jgi:hypothetical protein
MSRVSRLLLGIALVVGLLPSAAFAEPYLAAQMGLKCGQCHTNPTGGGLRNVFGNTFAQTEMPAKRLRKEGDEPWTGLLGKYFAVGGNLRANYNYNDVPNNEEQSSFDLEEGRVYLEAAIIPGRLSVYVDELVAPGNADNREANVRFWIRENSLYVKAGRMYLPFGWRLEDDTAFTRQLSGINMTTPDNGAEIGLESGPWSAQLAVSNGTGGGPEDDTGKQATLRAEFVQPVWRVGVSASANNSDVGDREAFAVHGAIRTGPIVWLGEVDYIKDDSLTPSPRDQYAALAEADWRIRAGHNLKLTFEYFEPDDDVDEDEQTRASLVYELTPVEFLQFRAGARIYDGIPQSDQQNRKLYFLQLHGFF